jgi:hypothetical protein
MALWQFQAGQRERAHVGNSFSVARVLRLALRFDTDRYCAGRNPTEIDDG